jgi:EpsI family protein
MIGHLSSMKLATGVDHLIYGWLFFGLVMFLMFWIGNYWREDQAATPAPTVRAPAAAARGGVAVALALVAMSALWPALALVNERANHNPRPVALNPVAVTWTAVPAFSGWVPSYMAPDAAFNGVYQAQAGMPVAMTVLYYRNQSNSKALVSSVNRLTGEKDAYHESGSSLRTEALGARQLTLRESVVQGPSANLLVWQWMWIDGRVTARNYVGKLWQAEAKLMVRGDDGAAVMLSAPYGDKPDEARAALRAFLAAHAESIDAALTATRQH